MPPGDTEALNAAHRIAEIFARTRGLTLTVVEGDNGAIRFV